jgi:hypothetical protein
VQYSNALARVIDEFLGIIPQNPEWISVSKTCVALLSFKRPVIEMLVSIDNVSTMERTICLLGTLRLFSIEYLSPRV